MPFPAPLTFLGRASTAAPPPAPSFDVLAGGSQTTDATTWTFTSLITYATDADRVIVGVAWETGTGATTVTGVTLGGVAMTAIAGTASGGNEFNRVQLWELSGGSLPAGGVARTVEVTLLNPSDGYVFAQSFKNTSGVRGFVTDTAVTALVEVLSTGSPNNALFVSLGEANGTSNIDPTAKHPNWTEQAQRSDATRGHVAAWATRGPVTAGDYGVEWSRSSASRFTAALVEIT